MINKSIPDRSRNSDTVQVAQDGRVAGSSHASTAEARRSTQALTDPVCGMSVTAKSSHVLQHHGRAIYFCSAGCKTKFAADPMKYQVAGKTAAPSPPPCLLYTSDAADDLLCVDLG